MLLMYMYDPKSEEKWNSYWIDNKMFKFDRNDKKRPLYVIDTPPPNPTGEMHMGQAFWVVYIDSIARYKRMKGYNVLYPQGWDTQGFPIELEVEKKYGKDMHRDEFYEKCVNLANENIKLLKGQMMRLGASFDESLEYITMSNEYKAKVQLSLIKMFEKGHIYRAAHPVWWCPNCKSSIAREEITEIEKDTKFNYIKFMLKSRKGSKPKTIEIATTRPELLHACVALSVNPNDPKYKKFIGKTVITPIFGKEVKIISDRLIDKDLGTGANMVCTFGDKNDISMYYLHGLNMVVSLDESGKLKNAGEFSGMAIPEARVAILKKLDDTGALIKQEDIKHTVKTHDRCSKEIELMSYIQWFMKTVKFANKIKEMASQIKWNHNSRLQMLIDWTNYIEWDWNISRNRIFGTPIPFWYCNDCGEIIPAKKDSLPINPVSAHPPIEICRKCNSTNIIGEKDVCDVWVDSSISPMVIAGWPENKKLFEAAFPNSIRIQGTDIIRTWAFYTIYRTYMLTEKKPFENIIVHGMILNEEGKAMHKSEGTGISPIALMDDYSIDSVRLWVASSGGTNKDKPFSYGEVDFNKSFITKIYNSALFIKNILTKVKLPKEEPHKTFGVFDLWILNRLNETIKQIDNAYDASNLFDVSNKLINFYWHEFCDYYIEDVKYKLRDDSKVSLKKKKAAAFTLMHVLDVSLKLLAPIIPHVAEEINSMFSKKSIFTKTFPVYKERESKADYIINGLIFKSAIIDMEYEDAGAFLNIIIGEVRRQKAQKRMALNKEITRMNINVPTSYYNVVSIAKEELENICKSKSIHINKSKDLSVSIEL